MVDNTWKVKVFNYNQLASLLGLPNVVRIVHGPNNRQYTVVYEVN